MILTFRDKFIKKYKLDEDKTYNLKAISDITKIPYNIILQIYKRGYAAAKTKPESVRTKDFKKINNTSKTNRLSSEQWGYGRVFGFVMKNPKQVLKDKPDYDLFKLI